MTLNPLDEAPQSVVEGGEFRYGRFSTPIPRVNMLDVARPYHYPVPQAVKRYRLKQWQTCQFGDEHWFFVAGFYSLPPFSQVVFHAYDRERKRKLGFRRSSIGRPFAFEEGQSSSLVFGRHRFQLKAFSRWDEGFIELEVANRTREHQFSGHFRLTTTTQQAAPISVCLPLGLNRAMYSTKALLPLSGEFTLDGETTKIEGPDGMGLWDDHKGYYPWLMHINQVSGFGSDAKRRRIGFNLTDNQVKDQAKYNENCLWINNRIYSLPPVRMTRPGGPMGEWIIQDTEGLVDLVFIPEVANDIRINLGVLASDYHGPFGSFRGMIRNGSGEKIEADRLFGLGEDKTLRL